MKQKQRIGLDDVLELFEDNIEIADIYAAKCLGELSAEITGERIALGMTQKEFANHLGISQGMVSRWEGGEYNFTIKGLAELAEKLDMELNVSMKRHREKVKINHLENTNYAYVLSEKKTFISNASNIISFSSRAANINEMRKKDIYNMDERKEM